MPISKKGVESSGFLQSANKLTSASKLGQGDAGVEGLDQTKDTSTGGRHLRLTKDTSTVSILGLTKDFPHKVLGLTISRVPWQLARLVILQRGAREVWHEI